MSDEAVSIESMRAEVQRLIVSQSALAHYVALWLFAWLLPPVALANGAWWGLGVAAVLVAAILWRPSFRLLWSLTDWFPVISVLATVGSMASTATVAITHDQRPTLWQVFGTGALVFLAWPAMSRFCRRYDLPDFNRAR